MSSFKISNQIHNKVNKNTLNFIHIAKTGGTSLEEFLNSNNIKFETHHLKKPPIPCSEYDKFLILIRNPIKRFVSTFNYYYSLINQDLVSLGYNISLDNCLSPFFTHQKLTKNYYFSPELDKNIVSFKNVNEFAESLTSDDSNIRNKAIELCNYNHFLGLSFYLDEGKFIEKYKNNILWIGKLEKIDEDIDKLKEILNLDNNISIKRIRENKNDVSKFLSEKAIQNIINFYQNDYKTLDILYKYNFIDLEILESYKKY